jgi:ferritin
MEDTNFLQDTVTEDQEDEKDAVNILDYLFALI